VEIEGPYGANGNRPSFLARCVDDPAEFLDGSWNSAPYVCRGTSERFSDLFSLPALRRLLSMGCIPHQYIRLIRNGVLASDREWSTLAPGTLEFIPDSQRIAAFVRDGYTLSIMEMHRLGAALAALCDGLGSELSRRVGATLYLTPKSSQGFGTHYDGHDVIVLQLAGEKAWKVFSRATDGPRWNKSVSLPPSQSPILATTIHAGDALYVPRGFAHSASADAEVSLHVSIGIYGPTVADLVRYAVEQAADLPAMSRELPVGFAAEPDQLVSLISSSGEILGAKLGESEWLLEIAGLFCDQWRGRSASPVMAKSD
jgi:bifunctional lysine-specific demethylase and histidyl-hydroxylase NO66